MARQNVIVEIISGISPTLKSFRKARREGTLKPIAVNFADGQSANLDTSQPRAELWAEVMESLQRDKTPVYVEFEPRTRVITEVLLPRSVTVTGIAPIPKSKNIRVDLSPSSGTHVLRQANPDFGALQEALRTAMSNGTLIWVTETLDSHEIIDIRAHPKAPALPAIPKLVPKPEGGEGGEISWPTAQALFNQIAATTCTPATAPPPCIPFLYPDDGCWARAHEMCRLMMLAGASPAKVWIYRSPGNLLHVKSANKPDCNVYWNWHVAPTLQVDMGSGVIETMVIDPSLFYEPVRLYQWKSVQGDANALLEPSDASVYHRSQGGASVSYDDANYTQTQNDLNNWGRNPLKLRCATYGPPPYSNCVPDIYIRDNPTDSGQEPLTGGGISMSPDINHYRSQLADPQGSLGAPALQDLDTLFEPIKYGQTNYIYLRLQNRGCAAVPAEIDLYYSLPSTLPAPAGWSLIGSLTTLPIVPGEFKVVGPIPWSTVPAPGHYCFISVMGCAQDPKPSLSNILTIANFYDLIRQKNNVTWKNFDVYDVVQGGTQELQFWVQGWPRQLYMGELHLDLTALPPGTKAELRLVKRLVPRVAQGVGNRIEKGNNLTLPLKSGALAVLRKIELKPGSKERVTLTITLPFNIKKGDYDIYAAQKVGGKEMGRVTWRLRVK
jgi:Glutaminase